MRRRGVARDQRVGHARRRAHVVLQDAEAPVCVAYDVEPGDADPRSGRRRDLAQVLEELDALEHVLGEQALHHGLALAVDVGDEHVQRPHALGQALLELRPLHRGQQAGDRVEPEQLAVPERRAAGAHVRRDALGDRLQIASP